MSKAEAKTKHKGESRSCYRLCVPPCQFYITSGDTHSLCMVCFGAKHAESAPKGADCPPCERLPLRTLCSRKALFEEGAFASVPCDAGPASAEAERQLHSWGSQVDLVEGMEMESLSPWDRKPILQFLPPGERARHSTYLPPRRLMWRASRRIRPFNCPSMRSCWRWLLARWPS